MKNIISHFATALLTLITISALMSYRPAEDTPKQYMIVSEGGIKTPGQLQEKLEKDVNQKLQEGWKPQGGIAVNSNGILYQTMVK